MTSASERRKRTRTRTNATGEIEVGDSRYPCRLIDVSETGAQVRIDQQRPNRSWIGKRIVLLAPSTVPDDGAPGSVVWVRPAVAGTYLGIQLDR